MTSNYLLLDQDYTVYNALAWGNCLGHFRRAFDSQSSISERVFHSAIALFETFPILSQSASLAEMAISHCFRPPLDDLLARHNAQMMESNAQIWSLPTQFYDLIFSLHRKIERQYRDLPWPSQMQKIVVLTEVNGGQGDVAAAAKAIALMQKICPTLTFDWVLFNSFFLPNKPKSYLNCDNPSNVHIRKCASEPPEKSPGDFLLTGPVSLGWDQGYCESLLQRRIAGPLFGFKEIGRSPCVPSDLQTMVQNASPKADSEIYQDLHSHLFPSQPRNCTGQLTGQLPMGLLPGSGVLLDRSRINAPKSQDYCCPSYLPKIQDAELRKDILEAMNVFDSKSEPDYNRHSFNSGYAHHSASWGKFIDCVAIHEKKKDVVIVINRGGEFTKEFQDRIFTPERLAFLKEKGYRSVKYKEKGHERTFFQPEEEEEEEGRHLTVITRPSFAPEDMKYMQLASERLLATGDNSAVESWCSRCILYLYEDVANDMLGAKHRFLQQQVDLAKTISPNLSQLLALFGGDRRLPNCSLNKPLRKEEMVEMERLLGDPNLSDATLQFCKHITANYSFDKVLEGALKRAAWHHLIPALAKVEADNLGEKFQSGLVTYLKKKPKPSIGTLAVPDISVLGAQV
ncbi:MAG: hypothetical protein KR126chlam3_01265, partial [Chlamydiae bacterium]|nr:hypothetical protein [Chlamydiota bacterium]